MDSKRLFLLLPSGLISEGKQYGWLMEILATLYGITLAAIWLYLSKLHPGLNLIQISLRVMGKWFGGFIALLYIFLFTKELLMKLLFVSS
ncbi:GerAB/ArcD/ProY family transporter [Paenibacillus solisilvae]|uniref:GerAB/ArcD/ProY family transporter n=1 Tax=Paenibacillus solisilvae TaxID=2486751 RepID=A0ABW0W0K1_9BACL